MRISRHSMILGVAALAIATVCAGCSSSSGPNVTALGQQLEAITKSTNSELAKDRSASNTVLTDQKYAAAFHQAASRFHALTFPASMQADANALVKALNTMSTDATAVAKAAAKNQSVEANVTKMADLNLKLIEEEKVEKTAVNALRNDLGLGPEPTTTTTAPPPATLPPSTTTPSTTSPG